MLACLEPKLTISHHDDDQRFDQATKDIEWIPAIGNDKPSWIVLSFDNRILTKPEELTELRKANLTFFCFDKHWSSMGIYEQAWKLIKVWPDIREKSQTLQPTTFKVSAGQSLKIETLGLTVKLNSK